MPLIRVDISAEFPDELALLMLDEIHKAVVSSFEVPQKDRYQVIQKHDPAHFILQDSGLGFERSNQRVLISVTSRVRSKQSKLKFFHNVATNFKKIGIRGDDIIINITENSDSDWSFRNGEAQFITGELS